MNGTSNVVISIVMDNTITVDLRKPNYMIGLDLGLHLLVPVQ